MQSSSSPNHRFRFSHQRNLSRGNNQGRREDQTSPASKVAHTLTACCRCRTRKTKCDPGLPRCMSCVRSNANCKYLDTASGKIISRDYVVQLQDKVQQLEQELGQIERERQVPPDPEVMVRGAGLVSFKENDESRFLGPSSGIAMTRLVMESAKRNCNALSIKQIVPDTQALKNRAIKESSKDTSKVSSVESSCYPSISSVAAPSLPALELTEALVSNFNYKSQAMLPTLHEPSFRQDVYDVYQGSQDAYKNFAVRMVIAISLQKYDAQFAGLADSFYLAALPYLGDAIRPMDLGTLQCFALMAQYSLVTPTRTASYWVVGLATRLCQDLRLTDEASITGADSGMQFNALEIDMRRRVFWVILSMEFGLAHSLGRPSAFGMTYDHVDVGFFADVDDTYITPDGIPPGTLPSLKKLTAIHFFKMRMLQAEIRRKLYLKKRLTPKDDQDPWFSEMNVKLINWESSGPSDAKDDGLGKTWFHGRYNIMVVFLYRPSPQIPTPSLRAAQRCFDASIWNINMHRRQISTKEVDLTWVFTQSLFMALNTVLWALSYPEIRQEHPREEVEKNLSTAQEGIKLASERWPGVESALELYNSLIFASLKAYDGDSEAAGAPSSPYNKVSPASSQDFASPPSWSSPATINSSISSNRTDQRQEYTPPFGYVIDYNATGHHPANSSPALSEGYPPGCRTSWSFQDRVSPQPTFGSSTSLEDLAFDPNSSFNPLPLSTPELPAWDTPFVESIPRHLPDQIPMGYPGQDFYLGSIGDQYSRYLHAQYMPQQPLESLNSRQQSELMNTLEDRLGTNALHDTSSINISRDTTVPFFSQGYEM